MAFQSKTAEPMTGRWSARANAPAVAAAAAKATNKSLRVIISSLLCRETACGGGKGCSGSPSRQIEPLRGCGFSASDWTNAMKAQQTDVRVEDVYS
jgi:hypothetical protein